MINSCISRLILIPSVWFSFLNGQLVIEIQKGVSDPHIACCMKLVNNAVYWKDRGNLLLADECLQIALGCLKSMIHDAVTGGVDKEFEYARELQVDVEYYIHEVQEELRLINSDIYDPIKSVSPKKKQRLLRSLEYMETIEKAFWEEWAEEGASLDQPQETLISNVTEKEFALQPKPPHKVKKDSAADFSPRDVCNMSSSVVDCGTSHKKRKTE